VVNLLFHNFPDQKIVLVAHSNQALNDLFEKIVALDIPERYLLRLGRGIEDGNCVCSNAGVFIREELKALL